MMMYVNSSGLCLLMHGRSGQIPHLHEFGLFVYLDMIAFQSDLWVE